jgi:uncharacterized protein (DUF2062 family)
MKRIKLHLQACALFAPVFVALMCSTIILALIGAIYFAWIVFKWSSTINGRRFLRRYYHEILRLENML